VTIRQLEDEWVSAAKAKAAERGVSMNTVLKEAVKSGLGIVDKKKTNGLERCAGSCPDEFGEDFNISDCFGLFMNYLQQRGTKIPTNHV
jgi:hypothetical protein|tara:strand:+ start:8646 stop:8912 length:267 start_codon:yes stop_codon:yes gene_type:complete